MKNYLKIKEIIKKYTKMYRSNDPNYRFLEFHVTIYSDDDLQGKKMNFTCPQETHLLLKLFGNLPVHKDDVKLFSEYGYSHVDMIVLGSNITRRKEKETLDAHKIFVDRFVPYMLEKYSNDREIIVELSNRVIKSAKQVKDYEYAMRYFEKAIECRLKETGSKI